MEKNNSNLKNTLVGILIGSLLSGTIGFIVTFYQENKKIELERKQFESTLILGAIEKNNPEQSKKNIKFLIESKLISPKNEKIISLLTDSVYEIVLPKIDTIELKPQNPKILNFSKLVTELRAAQLVDENELPVVNAEVFVNPCYDKNLKKFRNCFSYTLTDSNGLFEITLPIEERYHFVIQKKGFETINMSCINNKRWVYRKKLRLDRVR